MDFAAIDCSGYVRTLLDYASGGATDHIPDGSWMEDQWFALTGFAPTEYANGALSDGHLRVAIHHPSGRGGDPVGHIWLVANGHTMESYGGHGPGERPWNHPWFLRQRRPLLCASVKDCHGDHATYERPALRLSPAGATSGSLPAWTIASCWFATGPSRAKHAKQAVLIASNALLP